MPALTHPPVRLVRENVPRAVFVELVPVVFGMYIGIFELCTFISDRIDQQFSVPIFQQCHRDMEVAQALSACIFFCIVDMSYGNASSNETRRGVFCNNIYKHYVTFLSPVPIEYEVGWNPEPIWLVWRRENNSDFSLSLWGHSGQTGFN